MWVNTKLEQLRTYFSANEPKKCSIELKSKISLFFTVLISANKQNNVQSNSFLKFHNFPHYTFTTNKHILEQINKK